MSKIVTNESFLKEILDTINPNIRLLGNYVRSTEKILCKCNVCGHEWGMLPGNIKKGRGCPKCMYKENGESRTNKAKDKFYNFVLQNCSFNVIGNYINSTTKIECECTICGHHWSPIPSNILKGQGCPKCGRKSCADKLTRPKEEIEKLLPETILLIQYTKVGAPALFKCKKCSHEWFCTPYNIISNHRGCPICNGYTRNNDIFIKQLSEINPDIEVLEEYVDATTKLQCKCKKCGCLWKSDPHHLLSGKGCPCCRKSKGEQLIHNILLKYNIIYESQYYLNTDFKSKIFVDFRIEMNNKIYFIEYNGIQHYEAIDYFGGITLFEKQKERDSYLRDYCKNNNIILLEIKYDVDSNDIENLILDNIYNNKCDKLAVDETLY